MVEENGYEKYSEWIDVIGKKCATMDPDVIYNERISYYKLDNGIGVMAKDGKVECIYENYVWPLDINEQFSIRTVQPIESSAGRVVLSKFQTPLIEYNEDKQSVQFSDRQDKAHLPSSLEGNYTDGELAGYPNLNPNMGELLREAADRAKDNQTKKEYEGAIDFIERLEHIIEQEKSKDEKENGYEEYCKWFEEINNACNENNLSRKENNGDEHYILGENIGNSMNVCKRYENGSVIIVVSEEEIDLDTPGTQPYCTFSKNKYGNITMRFFSSPLLGDIFYGTHDSVSYSALPDDMDRIYSKGIKKTENVGELLDDAIRKTTNEIYQNELRRAKEFYDSLSQIMEREMSGYDEYGYPKDIEDNDTPGAISEDAKLDDSNIDRENDDKMFSRADDFTPDELEQMSAEELEEMLRVTEEQNTTKKQILEETENEAKRKETERKKALIAQIKQAVDEGRDLDAKIMDAKDITKENK